MSLSLQSIGRICGSRLLYFDPLRPLVGGIVVVHAGIRQLAEVKGWDSAAGQHTHTHTHNRTAHGQIAGTVCLGPG